MMKRLDYLLDHVTMYRLLLYVLLTILGIGAVLTFFGRIAGSGWSVIASAAVLVAISWFTNVVFAWAFDAPTHDMSAYLTGLILALIISPIRTVADVPMYFWAPVLAIAAKYIVVFHRQHLFNPAAFAVALTALAINSSASWWVGNAWMLPVVIIGGFLIVRKIRRWDVVFAFLGAAFVSVTALTLLRHSPVLTTWKVLVLDSPIFFFAAIMLTEPQTMPPTHRWRLYYGAVIGVFFAPQLHIAKLYSTPELALLAGNLIFFFFARRDRYVLRLQGRQQISPTVCEFIFAPDRPIPALAGQYLEWTVPHPHADQRGLRRYFTLASAPTETEVRLGVKFYDPSSTFKGALYHLHPGHEIVAGQLDGDFTLPKDTQQKLAFIAGGIGITPFRSIIKSLLDQKKRRDIILFYTNQIESDIVYQDVFEQANAELGMRTVYTLSDEPRISTDWKGERGFITAELIQRQAPDFAQRMFYISGPQAMVEHYKLLLRQIGLPRKQIKTDYFPGFA